MNPDIQAFFDEETFTVSYLVSDPATRRRASSSIRCWISIPSRRARRPRSADRVLAAVKAEGPDGRLDPGNPRPCRSSVGARLSASTKPAPEIAIGEHITRRAEGLRADLQCDGCDGRRRADSTGF